MFYIDTKRGEPLNRIGLWLAIEDSAIVKKDFLIVKQIEKFPSFHNIHSDKRLGKFEEYIFFNLQN